MYHWKHGRKGSGVFWLQQARDEIRLSRIAQHLFDSVGKSISDESFKVKCYWFAHMSNLDIRKKKNNQFHFGNDTLFIVCTYSNGKAWLNCWVQNPRLRGVLNFCTSMSLCDLFSLYFREQYHYPHQLFIEIFSLKLLMCSRYRDFKKSLKQVYGGKTTDTARQAVESLILVSV